MCEGKVIVVTGGASGIGAATCLTLAAEGASVAVADRDFEGAEAVAASIVAAGGKAFAQRVDVTDPDDNLALMDETSRRFGGIDGVFLNAGIVIGSSLRDGDLDTWRRVMDVNLNGVFYGIRAAIRHLKPGSSIVINASGAGLRGSAYMPSYVASKHGVVGLMKAAAAEFARDNIRVNAICPGGILTPIAKTTDPAAIKLMGNGHPLKRMGRPEEIADMAAFLLSDRSTFITAQAIAVDGGVTNVLAQGEAFPDTPDTAMKETYARMNDD